MKEMTTRIPVGEVNITHNKDDNSFDVIFHPNPKLEYTATVTPTTTNHRRGEDETDLVFEWDYNVTPENWEEVQDQISELIFNNFKF